MTSWTRSDWTYRCGLCARQIDEGDPMFIISVPKVKQSLRRCRECAGEDVPELPPYVPGARHGKGKPQQPYRPVFSWMKDNDWKKLQSGE